VYKSFSLTGKSKFPYTLNVVTIPVTLGALMFSDKVNVLFITSILSLFLYSYFAVNVVKELLEKL